MAVRTTGLTIFIVIQTIAITPVLTHNDAMRWSLKRAVTCAFVSSHSSVIPSANNHIVSRIIAFTSGGIFTDFSLSKDDSIIALKYLYHAVLASLLCSQRSMSMTRRAH